MSGVVQSDKPSPIIQCIPIRKKINFYHK